MNFRLLYKFSFIIILSFYLACANLIFLSLVWWLNDSTFTLLEILYFASNSIIRILIIETIIGGIGFLLLFLVSVNHYQPTKLNLNTPTNIDKEDIIVPGKLVGMIFVAIGLIAIVGYLEGLGWQKALLEPVLWTLPITIATMFAFFLILLIGFVIIFLGNIFINRIQR